MKKYWQSLIFLLLLSMQMQGQITFQKTIGEAGSDNLRSVSKTTDGGYILTGYSIIGPDSRVYLLKVDKHGTLQWAKSYDGGLDYEVGNRVIQTNDGGYIVVGYTGSLGAGDRDVFVLKTDSSGTKQWAKTIGGSGTDEGWSVEQNTDNTYVIGGFTQSFPGPDAEFYLIKLSSTGTLIFDKTYGGSGYERAYSVHKTADNGYALFGDATGFGAGSYDYYLVKTDGQGTLVWSKTYGGGNGDFAASAQLTSDNGFILTGFADNYGPGARDMAVVKTDSAGTPTWAKVYGKSGSESAYSAIQTIDSGYAIAGYSSSFNFGGGSSETTLIKTDAGGNIVWSEIFGDCGAEYTSIQQSADEGYILTGTAFADFRIIKTDATGQSGCNEADSTFTAMTWSITTNSPVSASADPAATVNTVTTSVTEYSQSPSATTECYSSVCNFAVNPMVVSPVCSGSCIGYASTDVTGGTPPYSYSWNSIPIQTTAAATGLCTGTYIVTVNDDEGCIETDSVSVVINPPPSVSLTLSPATVCTSSGAYALTGGSPAGGTYSGTAVNGGIFDPGAAGAGTYTITYAYTNGNNCTDSAQQTIVVDLCTGVHQPFGNESIIISPNPSNDNFSISMSAEGLKDIQLIVMDVQGRTVYQLSEKISNNTFVKNIRLETLPKGIYTIQIISNLGVVGKKLTLLK